MDAVCAQAMVPAITACGLEPKRVDKHNQGGLLKSEIIKFIQDAEIVVADLTNERPNVYLEVGYTMGVDKFRNLILTVRRDHFPDDPAYARGGPKVHFDLGGYDILLWDPTDLSTFTNELEKRIRRRLLTLPAPAAAARAIWDTDWLDAQRSTANAGLLQLESSGFMEVRAALHPPKIAKTQTELNEAARVSEIRTFGWPIAPYINRDDAKPRPRADGIVAEIRGKHTQSYDYWAIRRNGDFYFVGSLFEDKRFANVLFFNTRIVRVAEALLYCAKLYSNLGSDPSSQLSIGFRHGGLAGRVLTSSNPNRELFPERRSAERESDTEVTTTIGGIESRLVELVEEVVAPMLVLFEFFVLNRRVYEDIVNRFVKGEVT